MQNFDFCSPTRFVFGKNTELRAGELCSQYGSRVLLHFGGGSVVKSGLLERIKKSLEEAGLAICELGGVQPNPIATLVYQGIALCRKERVNFILAIGGGSVIDSAKAIAIGVPYDGDFWDFYSGRAPKKALPIGTILTIPAAGSEGSKVSVITNEKFKLKRSCDNQILRAAFSIMNPELTYTLPAYQTACGAVDIMAHVLERYMTNTKGVELTDRLCEAVLKTIITQAPIVMKNPSDYDARANMMWASTIAHNNLLDTGRQGDWSCHQMDHELGALYNVTHGAGLAVMLPAYMRYVYQHDVGRFAQMANRLFDIPMDDTDPKSTALEGINRLEKFFVSLDMPVTFAQLGAKAEDIPYLADHVRLTNNGEKLGFFVPLDKEQIKEIYKLACK